MDYHSYSRADTYPKRLMRDPYDPHWGIQYIKFRFSPGLFGGKTRLLRAMFVESHQRLPEIFINSDHPLYHSRVGSQHDELYEKKLIQYVGTVSAAAYVSQKFTVIPNASEMRNLAEKFEASFVREWKCLSEAMPLAPRMKPSLTMTKKFFPTGADQIETRFSTPTLASVSRSPGYSTTKSSSSILSVDIETAKANLYVCGIPRNWKKEDLYSKFAPYGEILSCKIWSNRCDSEQNAGSGFVQFVEHVDAQNAVNELNGTQIKDMLRPLQVKFANTRKKRSPGKIMGENLYVSGLPTDFNDEDLHALFLPFGEIESVLVLPPKAEYSALTGFVRFFNREDANNALRKIDRTLIPETKNVISCSWAKGSKKSKAQSCTNVYITGCDPLWKDHDVFEFFSHFGEITSVAMMNPRQDKGHENAIAFVKFRSAIAAQNCIDTANGIRLPTMHIPLSVRFSKHQNV
jgi:RNA recognition motif-containing protein